MFKRQDFDLPPEKIVDLFYMDVPDYQQIYLKNLLLVADRFLTETADGRFQPLLVLATIFNAMADGQFNSLSETKLSPATTEAVIQQQVEQLEKRMRRRIAATSEQRHQQATVEKLMAADGVMSTNAMLAEAFRAGVAYQRDIYPNVQSAAKEDCGEQ